MHWICCGCGLVWYEHVQSAVWQVWWDGYSSPFRTSPMRKHGKLMKSTPRESRCGARALAGQKSIEKWWVSYFLAKASFHVWRLSSRSDAIHVILFSADTEYNYIMSANQFLLRLEKKKSAYFFALDSEGSCSLTFRWCPLVFPSLQQLLLLGGLHNTFAACEALNPYPFHLMVQAVAPCMQPGS